MSMIQENIDFCLKRIQGACARSGRFLEDITFVVVTKGVGLSLVCEALDCGIVHIGESRMQEALTKYDALNVYAKERGRQIIWHMIGHLQTNKAKDAVRIFDLIHSLDSVRLARHIDFEAQRVSKVQDVLVQVNVSGDPGRFGFSYDSVDKVLEELKQFKHINVKGLMTIAPFTDESLVIRECFCKLKTLKDKMRHDGFDSLFILSMGMTHDFETAIEEGATMVRIGTAIFGERVG